MKKLNSTTPTFPLDTYKDLFADLREVERLLLINLVMTINDYTKLDINSPVSKDTVGRNTRFNKLSGSRQVIRNKIFDRFQNTPDKSLELAGIMENLTKIPDEILKKMQIKSDLLEKRRKEKSDAKYIDVKKAKLFILSNIDVLTKEELKSLSETISTRLTKK